MSSRKEKTIEQLVTQLAKTPTQELSKKLKDIHELRTGERKPAAPLLFGYPSTDEEIAAYERIINGLRKTTTAARLPDRPAPFNVLATHFGGQPYAEAGDCWPDCEACGLSLNFICQISVNIPLSGGAVTRLLYVVYYCFQCRPAATAAGMGFITHAYWNPTPSAAEPIEPLTDLSAPPLEPRAPISMRDVYYLPTIRELDVEDCGLPMQYYLGRFDNFIDDLKDSVAMIDGGPYPPYAQFLNCQECGEAMEVTFSIFLDGLFSLLCCPAHPHNLIGFHTEYDDCAVGPVRYEILA